MGAPPPPDEMLRMLDDPNFAQTMNEALNNPDMLRILEQHPMMRDNPQLRNMIRNPEMRRLMFNPEMLRMQLQMQRSMGGDAGAGGDFPAPGVTDQTPGGTGTGAAPTGNAAANPLASLFGNMGAGSGGAGGPNHLAALFGNMGGAGTTPVTSPPAAASTGQGTPSTNQGQAQDPFANLFGAAQGGAGGNDPLAQMTRTMMQNPEMMRNVMQMMGGQDGPPAAGGEAGGAAANPFAQLFNPAAFGGMGGMGGMMPPQAQEPPDTRPPEERYESQLRQLNDMGFYEFDRNIAALRRSGGSVQGAIEHLLGGS
jgi:ubiquilin